MGSSIDATVNPYYYKGELNASFDFFFFFLVVHTVNPPPIMTTCF